MKLIVKPQYVTWGEAKRLAHLLDGRLVSYREMMRWSNNEAIEIDIWIDHKAEDRAQYFDAAKQDIRFKELNEKCLLVFLADPKKMKLLKQLELEKQQLESQTRKLLNRNR
jgi:hypothetical protein